jgi:hypothetical protein
MCKSQTSVRLGKLTMVWRTLIAAILLDGYLPRIPRQDYILNRMNAPALSFRSDPTKKTTSNNFSLVVCVSTAAETSSHLLFISHCIAADGFYC